MGELLKELRYTDAFMALAEELNFSRAADRLNMAQQQLSKQISRFEENLGVQLFSRNTRHVALTSAGAVAYRELSEVIRRVSIAEDAICRASRGETGRLTIGAGAYPLESALPQILGEFGRRYPGVSITIERLTARDQLDALLAGAIDIGFPLRPPARSGLDYEPVAADTFAVLVRDDDPRHGVQPLRAFSDDQFLLAPPHLAPGLRAFFDQLFRAAGFEPKQRELAGGTRGLQSLVAAGAGVMLGPSLNFRHLVENVRVVDLDSGRHAVLFAAMRSEPHDEAAQNFLDILRTLRDREGWIA